MSEPSLEQAVILQRIADAIEHGLTANGEAQQLPVHASGPKLTPASQHFAKLAHELKTPLSAIVAAAEIMRDERFGPIGDERYRGYAASIFESAGHALGVINAILGAPATPGARQEALAFAEIDLNEVCERTVSSVGALLEAAGLSITHRLEPGLPRVIADPVTVQQMLLNLVTNAMRATPAGGTVAIATAYELAGPVHVTVSDTGTGMAAADIARALDGARETDFAPRPTGGLGLGYPLILSLAKANGATLAISSAGGEGTVVRISFAPDRVIPV